MLNVRVKNEAKVFGAIRRLAEGVSDFRRRWGRNIKIRLRHQREWMDTKGRGTWQKLTDIYLERKSHDPKAAFLEILQLTGHLYRSLAESGSSDSVIDEGKTRLVMGTSDPKARLHHEGRGSLPIRRVIAIEHDEVLEHSEALYGSLAEMARTEGFRTLN
jgi:hypothetical protein